jgi:D-3-phosphoglycerate dehydrogenase / 2-oxoglutarate reductase
MKGTVFVTDMVFPDFATERAILEPLGYGLRYCGELRDEEEIAREAADAVAILTCFAQVSADAIAGAADLRVVGRYGVGVDNIAVSAASGRGIPVTNVREYCVDEVSEHAIALAFALARKTAEADRDVRAGGWPVLGLKPIRRMAGRPFGVVGFGRIARAVAAKAAALGMPVLAYDPFLDDAEIAAAGATPVSLVQLLAEAAFVSLHVPLTPETHHLIDAERIALMRDDAILINTARGPLVDGDALAAALADGRLAGAGLDVLETEPPPAGHPLLALPNVVVTPHVAFYSEESLIELKRRATENVAAVLEGRDTDAIVNGAALA